MNQPDAPIFPHLVVGLGNPGPRYRATRHNLGFRVVESLAKKWTLPFSESDGRYLGTRVQVGRPGCVLLKPLTYMNLSGEALATWLQHHNLEPDFQRILVVCDDLALPLGTLRLRSRGSSGGQNGLLSVIEQLGTDRFARLRLGIDGTGGQILPEKWPDYVLTDFNPQEKAQAEILIERAVQAVECWWENGPEQAASRFNGGPQPPVDN